MLTGHIKDDRPVISIIVGSQLGVQELFALVDTGFTGELKVSAKTAEELGLQITHTEKVSLATDVPVSMGAGPARLSLENETKEVSVLIGGLRSSIGVALLRSFGYILTMDFSSDEFTLRKKSDDPFEIEE